MLKCLSRLAPRCYPLYRHSSTTTKPLICLGLESSADDSCAAIVDSNKNILANVVIKQDELNQAWGGIHPLWAQEQHQKNMPLAIQRCFSQANLTLNDIDAIAYTRGPGIASCLSVAVMSAKALASATSKPLLGVHHMQAHALTASLVTTPTPSYPFLTLLISGGHTLLLLATSESQFEILATTLDDAIGNALDKITRTLQIPTSYGIGGAALENYALSRPSTPDAPRPEFPVAMPGRLAFSFSGVKTSVFQYIEKLGGIEKVAEVERRRIAGAFQEAVFGQLENKVLMVLKGGRKAGDGRVVRAVGVESVVVSGGVASNKVLRERLRVMLDKNGFGHVRLLFPPLELCTDNAAMIAWTGLLKLARNKADTSLDLPHEPIWSIEECESEQSSTRTKRKKQPPNVS